MPSNLPQSIPSPYNNNEKTIDAYKTGWNHGHGIACHNVPVIGYSTWTDGLGSVIVDADNIREVHQSMCFEAESNSRQYSPFEFTAHEFNEDEEYSEELWAAFNDGVYDSIIADLETYSDADYGIDEAA
jgi:hypothetical protein